MYCKMLSSSSSTSSGSGSFYSSNTTTAAIASLSAMNEIQTIAQHVETKTNYLLSLKEGIENMPVVHQIEVLRILCSKNTQINENKNGVFVNISRLNNDLIQELYDYMKYFINQENHLNEIEQQKQSLTKEFFDK